MKSILAYSCYKVYRVRFEITKKGEVIMKKYISQFLALALSVMVIPAVPVYISGRSAKAEKKASVPEESVIPETSVSGESPEEAKETAPAAVDPGEPYKVLDMASGQVIEVPVRDYVIGAVCAEMPASFHEEALKAQAVAAHTYAERQRIRERRSPTADLMGADFSNDTSRYQGYFTEAQARQYFGENFEESYKKISDAADEVLPYIITYDDEPIVAAFHSMSTGKTESAENAWGAAAPYLVPVDSSYDTKAPGYIEEIRFTKDVLRQKLETAFPGIVLGEDMTGWISAEESSGSGTVLRAKAGDKSVSGNDLRQALSLRSACFDVRWEGDEAVFTTRGYGHGVGMSQYGADSMAQEGKNWKEILNHYYPNAELKTST